MDAKSRAEFINSVASGSKKVCPNCQTLNEADAAFCAICGEKLNVKNEYAATQEKQLFSQVSPQAVQRDNRESINAIEKEKNALAIGLPKWTIEPPQVMVRRKR